MQKKEGDGLKLFDNTLTHLKNKKRILFLTTSTRWEKAKVEPKSTQIAKLFQKKLGKKVKIIDVSKLRIYTCEGNVSNADGNSCGLKGASLKDKFKNPSECHRCWVSFNKKDDELWKISKELLQSDCVVFFASVRWGQTNSVYQKLIERLTWLENRHSTLGEENILKNIDAGIIIFGHNWNGKVVLETQKNVLKFFGFNVVKDICWNWQFLNNSSDETQEEYKKDFQVFKKIFIQK